MTNRTHTSDLARTAWVGPHKLCSSTQRRWDKLWQPVRDHLLLHHVHKITCILSNLVVTRGIWALKGQQIRCQNSAWLTIPSLQPFWCIFSSTSSSGYRKLCLTVWLETKWRLLSLHSVFSKYKSLNFNYMSSSFHCTWCKNEEKNKFGERTNEFTWTAQNKSVL